MPPSRPRQFALFICWLIAFYAVWISVVASGNYWQAVREHWGIAVAMLAALHPLGVVLSAVFLAGIYVGAESMSRAVNIPTYIADVLVASSVLAVLVSLMLVRFRVRFR